MPGMAVSLSPTHRHLQKCPSLFPDALVTDDLLALTAVAAQGQLPGPKGCGIELACSV